VAPATPAIPTKTPRLPDGRPDWLTQCTKLCGAACCRYIGVPIAPARTAAEFDEWRWYLAHAGVSIYRSSRQWYLNVETRCQYLTAERTCAVYATRPRTCADYDPSSCEWQDPDGVWDTVFHTPEELARWLDARRTRRAAAARARRARRRRAARKPRRAARRSA
jgi:Fe-S-cluster containining protein